MTTLAERAARRMARRALDGLLEPHLSREIEAMWPALAEDAEEAIRETLDAMREPSEARGAARLAMWRDTRARPSASDWLAAVVDADLRAFAREHGIATPPAQEQRP